MIILEVSHRRLGNTFAQRRIIACVTSSGNVTEKDHMKPICQTPGIGHLLLSSRGPLDMTMTVRNPDTSRPPVGQTAAQLGSVLSEHVDSLAE